MTRSGRETPIVAVAADFKEIDGYRWHAAAETYLKAVVAGIGGIPLIFPSLGETIDFDALLDRVDGVLLPGSRSNVHPGRYGDTPSPRAEPYDPRRDATTLPLIHATLRWGVPLFAICRGMQELNVALGGTLFPEVHEIAGRSDHRAPAVDDQDVRFAIRQNVDIRSGGALADILGAGRVQVNSLHRQAIGRLGDGLAVEATAPDGTIEAVRVTGVPGFAIGVQWHPEYWVESDQPSAKLFAAFRRAISERMAGRIPGAAKTSAGMPAPVG
jgi:putative glutamine amidotransferase